MANPTQTNPTLPAAPLLEGSGNLITDSCTVKLQLVESADKTGKVFVRGEFGRANSATENKRVYPSKLWEREFSRLEDTMGKRQMFGETDHPADGRTSLNRVSHVITNLRLNDEGVVIGEAEILDTERGRNLKVMLEAGCSVGVSSRGYGSIKPNDKGEDVVQEDYRLVTYDFVAEPADTKALPKVFFEENQHLEGKDLDAKIAEEREKLKAEFAKNLISALVTVKAEAREQVKAEMLADPEIAGSKVILDKVMEAVRALVVPESVEEAMIPKDAEIAALKAVIAERDLTIYQLKADTEVLAEAAREVGYRYYVEQKLANDPDAAYIRKMVGDVTSFIKVEDISTKIEAIRSELSSKRSEKAALDLKIKTESEKVLKVANAATHKAQLEAKAATERAEKLEEALEKTVSSQKEIALKLYTEKKLATHPKADKVRSIVESSHLTSKSEVDDILQSLASVPTRQADQVESVRARVRNLTKGGLGATALDEEAPALTSKKVADFNGTGMSVGDLKRLSGIDGQ